jgi:predicted RNA binding protein YcfA (HicA-like mRNA interferase family)
VAWVGGQWEPVSEAGFDHEQLAVFVWRADRAGGDTKTPKSRRTLALPRRCVEALREHRVRQAEDRLAAGLLWQDHRLVFASTVGTPQDDHNVRRQFRVITEAAGLGNTWVPRELRHTFVSLLSAHGVPVEAIALLAGHNQTATTELVYRHQIVPARQKGSHRQYKHPSKRGLVTVAGKPSDDIHPKTRDSILKQAGLNEDGSQAEQAGTGKS